MKILNLEEARSFVTKADLEKLEAGIANGSLEADLIDGQPVILVRHQPVQLFVILDMIGSL